MKLPTVPPVIGLPPWRRFFEPTAENPFDYMWFNGWTSDQERDAGWAAYNEAAHAATAGEFSTCNGPFIFDSRVIYMAGS